MNCPICDFENVDHEVFNAGEMWKFMCPRCGDYKSTDSAKGTLGKLSKADKTRLSIIIRNRNLQKLDPFEFDTININQIVETFYELSVRQKIEKLILNLSMIVSEPFEKIDLNWSFDWPLAYAKDSNELKKYLTYLEQQQYINIIGSTQYIDQILLTIEGWDYINEISKINVDTSKAFIAMNFDPEFSEVYDKAIKPAVESNGYNPVRVDKEEHLNLIDDFIIAEIKESKFVVAEFTGQKHGVYFEAGFAKGLGIPVIWVCKKDDMENLHFDTSHYNQIDWEDYEDLKNRLSNRIRATIS